MVVSTNAAAAETLLGSSPGQLALKVRGLHSDGQLVRLTSQKCTVGSGSRCTLRLRARGVQSLHCLILRGHDSTIVRRWAPGTRLNGQAFTDATLAAGDRLMIGPVEIEVVAVAAENAASNPPTNSAIETSQQPSGGVDADASAELARLRELSLRRLDQLRESRRRGKQFLSHLRDARMYAEQLAAMPSTANSLDELAVELERVKDEFNQEREQFRATIAERDQTLSQLSEKREETLRECKAREDEIAQLRQMIDEQRLVLQQSAANHETAGEQARQQLETLRAQLEADLEQREQQLSDELSQFTDSQLELARQRESLQDEREQIAAQQAQLSEEISAAQQSLQEREDALNERQLALDNQQAAQSARQHESESEAAATNSERDAAASDWDAGSHEAWNEPLTDETPGSSSDPGGLEPHSDFEAHTNDAASRETGFDPSLNVDAADFDASLHEASGNSVSPESPPVADELVFERPSDVAPCDSASTLQRLGASTVWDDDALDGNDDLDVSEPLTSFGDTAMSDMLDTASEPLPHEPLSEAEAVESEAEEEESIEDYMAKLMSRVRGDDLSHTSTPSMPAKRVSRESASRPAAGSPSAREVQEEDHESKSNAAAPFTLKPRTLAPEQSSSLAAMRELANSSARTAIDASVQARWVRAAIGKFVIGSVALVAALLLLMWTDDYQSTTFLATAVAGVIAVFWLLQSAIVFRNVLQAPATERPDASPQDDAAAQPSIM